MKTAICAVTVLAVSTVNAADGLGGGGPFGEQTTPCLSAVDRANAAHGIAEYSASTTCKDRMSVAHYALPAFSIARARSICTITFRVAACED